MNHRCDSGSISAIYVPVLFGNRPRFEGRFIRMAWDEMKMKVLGSLTKDNCIHALTSADLFHEITGIPNSAPPIRSLGRREIHGARTVPS